MSTQTKQYDVVVIGGGPGGYVAAIRASQLGLKVAVVEKAHMGGICLNWGCIPTKALLKSAELKQQIDHASAYGLRVQGVEIDFAGIIARSRSVAERLSKGVSFLMKKNKIDILNGHGKFKNANTLTVETDGETSAVHFTYAIIATGARAKEIPGVLAADGQHIWTYKQAMTPTELPKTLLVIGAGAIGVEFASFYAALGSTVTLVEAQDRLVPVEDQDISKELQKHLTARGITCETNAKAANLRSTATGVGVDLNGTARTFDRAILAIGVVGNIEHLNLDVLSIRTEKNAITVNTMYQTNVPHIYGIGDVIGAPWLAHVASHEGVIAAEHIAFSAGKATSKPHGLEYHNIPGCTYCTPQIGSTGLTEAAAKAAGKAIKVGVFPYQANGKALAIGEEAGFVKTIYDAQTGALLGAHIIGAEATEMIATFVLGKHLEAVEADFIHACLPHPTLSEMIGEATLLAYGRPLNS